jgi:hypothetical protein
MNNKNVPLETKALEIPDVALVELEDKLELLGQKINTLEERLKNVSRPYEPCVRAIHKVSGPYEVGGLEAAQVASASKYSTTLGMRIDKSVASVHTAVDRLRTILDCLEV